MKQKKINKNFPPTDAAQIVQTSERLRANQTSDLREFAGCGKIYNADSPSILILFAKGLLS